MTTELSKIKQPTPSVSASNTTEIDGKKYKIIQAANVGVVSAPKVSTTPLTDWVEFKKEENPHIKYKLKGKKYNHKNLQTLFSLGIISCAVISVIKLIGNKK